MPDFTLAEYVRATLGAIVIVAVGWLTVVLYYLALS